MIRLRSQRTFAAAAALLLAAPCLANDLTGRVLDATGKPVAGARVLAAESTVAQILYSKPDGAYATSPSETDTQLGTVGHLTGDARTDAQGAFAIHGLRAARFTLFAVEAAHGFATRLDVGSDSGPIDLAMTPGASIEGEFKGFKVDGTKHVLQLKPRVPYANILCSPNVEYGKGDRFSFGPLPPVDGWNVVLTEWVIERAFSSTLVSMPVRAAPGAATRVTLDFSGAVSVSGNVRGAHGEPLANVAVVARHEPTDGAERGAVTGEDGSYAIRGLADGAWTLEARRWTVRPTAGCGVGPKDVFASRVLSLPLEGASAVDLQVTKLLAAPQLGESAPTFSVKAIDGRTIELAELRGKVVLVDFWATWCGMCRAEFPRLRDTYAQFGGGRDFEIVGVSIDEDIDAARRVSAGLKLAWPQTALGPVEKNPLAQIFNIAATPSSFLLDRTGKIVAINVSGEDLRRELAKLLPPK